MLYFVKTSIIYHWKRLVVAAITGGPYKPLKHLSKIIVFLYWIWLSLLRNKEKKPMISQKLV